MKILNAMLMTLFLSLYAFSIIEWLPNKVNYEVPKIIWHIVNN